MNRASQSRASWHLRGPDDGQGWERIGYRDKPVIAKEKKKQERHGRQHGFLCDTHDRRRGRVGRTERALQLSTALRMSWPG